MRILHTADWHLGRTLHGADLGPAQAGFLDHLVETVRSERVDAVVVAGDVYDRAFPTLDAVGLLEEALVRLCELTRVVVIPGNHDSAVRLGFGSALYRDRLIVRSKPRQAMTPVAIPDADGALSALIYGVPYLDPDAARVSLAPSPEQPLARSHQAALGVVLDQVSDDLERHRDQQRRRVPAVLTAHAFVAGGFACDSERDIRVGGVDAVPAALFDDTGLDYVALGHLHGPQRVGDGEGPGPQLRYAGAPVALSFSEQHQLKSSVLVEVSEAGVAHTLVPAPVARPLSEVTGTLDEVLSSRFEAQREHWVRVVIAGEHRPPDLVATVKRAFPEALEVRFSALGVARGALPARQGPDTLGVLTDFVTSVRGLPPDARERLVLREAHEAASALEAVR